MCSKWWPFESADVFVKKYGVHLQGCENASAWLTSYQRQIIREAQGNGSGEEQPHHAPEVQLLSRHTAWKVGMINYSCQKNQDLGWEKGIDIRFSVWGISQNDSGNLLARSTHDFLLREEKFVSVQHANVGMCVSGDKKKHRFASSRLLSQTSSLSVVYHFHLLHIIHKYLQINPKFRGQATKSHTSSDPSHDRAKKRWLVLCDCHHQQRPSRDRGHLPELLWALKWLLQLLPAQLNFMN